VNALAYGIRSALTALQGYTNNQSFTWTRRDGTTAQVLCVPAMDREANAPIIGGFDDTGGTVLYVQFRDWLTADSTLVSVDSTLWTADNNGKERSVVGRTVGFNGSTLRITACAVAPTGSHYELTLASSRR
jgi:hypothetical protein